MNNFAAIVFFLIAFQTLFAQHIQHEGYVFESSNRGYLKDAKLVFTDDSGIALDSCMTNKEGYYSLRLPSLDVYQLKVTKDMYHDKDLRVHNTSSKEGQSVFTKIELKRKPGYLFEITLANKKDDKALESEAIEGALIEVYNNTIKEEVMVLMNYMEPEFKVWLTKGNHYTILIRKPEYMAKRMEAFVDVEGCILCFEGIGTIEPGVSDNLSDNNQMGVLLANVELERIFRGKKVNLNHLYYDFGKWDLKSDSKEELDKVVTLMVDNHKAKVELGAHTDSRGSNEDNMNLSWLRAKSAVRYLISNGINKNRIVAKGYGETELRNHCSDGVECSEAEHLKNRRTELKILSLSDNLGDMKSLAQIKREEQMAETIKEIQFSGQIRVPKGMELKEYLESKEMEDKGSDEVSLEATSQKEIPASHFSVVKIVIRESPLELSPNHELYLRHPNLIEFRQEEDIFLYMVGLFDSVDEAQEFMEKTIHLVYPQAYMVKIVDGKVLKL